MKKAKVTLTGKFKGKKSKLPKITFKGNKNYKAVTKKAKITVKK